MSQLTLHHVRIPMRYSFGHARAARAQADNLVVSFRVGESTGWGEGVPRDYVTGETIDGAFASFTVDRVSPFVPPAGLDLAQAARRAWQGDLAGSLGGVRPANALACAVETAILDAYARRDGVSVFAAASAVDELVPLLRGLPSSRIVQTLTLGDDIEAALQRAGQVGDSIEVKLKVGFGREQDVRRVELVRARLGSEIDLRLDANGAWSLEEACDIVRALEPHRISSIEEPLPPRELGAYAQLRRQVAVPIMLDESLCTLQDARDAAAAGAADLFNLRLSKCGGILSTLRIALSASQRGIGYQLGCMVGESGILSSLGRGFAGRVVGVRHLESTVPRLSLEQDLTDGTFEIEPETRLTGVPTGVGIGVGVDAALVDRFTLRRATIDFA